MNEIQSINQQMALIANLARAYANATPEQRANVSLSDMQKQLNRYNELKARRNELYAEQEARVQAELEAQRQAAQQQINTRGTWRRVNYRRNDMWPEAIVTRWVKQFSAWDWNIYDIQPWQVITDSQWNSYIYDQFSWNIDYIWQNKWWLWTESFIPVNNKWWLNQPWAIAFDSDWQHVMNSNGTITTTYNSWLRSDRPGSFSITPSGTYTIDSIWNQNVISNTWSYNNWFGNNNYTNNQNNNYTNNQNNNVNNNVIWPETAKRNAMPWYKQLITPYSEGYIRENFPW